MVTTPQVGARHHAPDSPRSDQRLTEPPGALWTPDQALIAELARVIHRATYTADGGGIGTQLCTSAARKVVVHLHDTGALP